MKRAVTSIFLCLICLTPVHANEISHYSAGLPNIRDFVLPPDTGFYVSSYNFYYQTGRLNGADGNEKLFTILDPRTETIESIDPDVDVYMMSIPMLWVKKEFLKEHFPGLCDEIDYGFLVAPTVANSSVAASLSAEDDRARDPITSEFGFGDLFVQPLWLGAAPSSKFSWSVAWGFYAPTGKYDTRVAEVAPGYTVRVPSIKNIGFGFWTNQLRGALQWSPFATPDPKDNDGPTFVAAGTYEINSEKEDFELTPGDHFSLNWGVTQLVFHHATGLNEGLLGEVALVGYDTWQVTADSGRDRENDVHDEVHAAGFQVGLTAYPSLASVNFHYLCEYASEDRFQGHVLGLSLSYHFGGPATQETKKTTQPD